MDIPNTGAIFTLGKSHLAENTQSYFYIKNDPVRRLTSGANQSAVICESGRLFVWGENHYGQLGVGAGSSSGHNDIVTKPTCVKSLKTLGLKIADMAFGNGWSVILTYSNEIFFTGRTIFAPDVKVSENFTNTTIGGEKCSIIRKPFRLEQFDDNLSTSEDQEDFIGISSGATHFALLTSHGRLIGWGSNEHYQLGSNETELSEPHEIVLDSKVKKFVCGPTSTLILTENESLYLTGRLKEFVFPQFTELQKNLSAQEKILLMHISQASEIYIVTNEGGIYHSIESKRNSSLIFQRFYDYDSEENGQIVKLLRGTSFYAALTKANKFYTTFSESGHHLKTFREISKFKNLRTLDIVVGDQHILVHGIPRSANKHLNKTFVVRPDSNANIKQVPLQSSIVEGNIPDEAEEREDRNNNETVKPNTPIHVEHADGLVEVPTTDIEEDHKETETKSPESKKDASPVVSPSKNSDRLGDSSPTSMKSGEYRKLDESEMESNNSTPSKKTILTARAEDSTSSPTVSVRSRKGSAKSIRFDEKSLKKQNSTERIVRPRTPYPDDATPKMGNHLGDDDIEQLDKTSPAFNDSLDNIPKTVAAFHSDERAESGKSKASTKKRKLTPIHRDVHPEIPNEEDEQLAVEISSTDFLDKTVVNEIRFINNGIDVTENVSKTLLPKIDSVSSDLEEEASNDIEEVKETIKSTAESVKNKATSAADTAVDKIQTEADKTIEDTKEKTESVSTEASSAFGMVSGKVNAAVAKVSSEVDNVAEKVSSTFDSAITSISEGVDNTMASMSSTMSTTVSKISTKVDDAKQNISSLLSGGNNKDETPSKTEASTPNDSSKIDDDERTTASVNSTGSGNPFENEHDQTFVPVKHTLDNEIRETGETGKNKVKQFFTDMKAKGKGMSCRDDRAIRIEDDPPKYTPVDEYADPSNRTSKVCVIL